MSDPWKILIRREIISPEQLEEAQKGLEEARKDAKEVTAEALKSASGRDAVQRRAAGLRQRKCWVMPTAGSTDRLVGDLAAALGHDSGQPRPDRA